MVGEGGRASAVQIFEGNSGAVRIRQPKFYTNSLPAERGSLRHTTPLEMPPPKPDHLIIPPVPKPPMQGDADAQDVGIVAIFNGGDDDGSDDGSSGSSLNGSDNDEEEGNEFSGSSDYDYNVDDGDDDYY